MAKYENVNGKWPVGTNEGRDLIPTNQEAITGAKRLWRKAFGKAFKGKVQITSGRRYTWVRNHVLYVNPNQKTWKGNGGWHEIVHGISHIASQRLWKENHGPRHAFIERELIEYVVNNGFLDGKLKREIKAKPDKREIRYSNVVTRIARWETKLKRAQTALRKLRSTKARYARYDKAA